MAFVTLIIDLSAAEPEKSGGDSEKTDLILEEDFSEGDPGRGWNPTSGKWTVVDGVLRGSEIPDEKHAAATRRVLRTRDAVYEMKFRFVGEGKGFHFGFDPASGQLQKRGHLFSVIVTPGKWWILKHVDKDRPEEDPNRVLVSADITFEIGHWYHLQVTTEGTSVIAVIDGKEPLKTSHETFNVIKPTLVFRCLGDGVEIDEVKVRGALIPN